MRIVGALACHSIWFTLTHFVAAVDSVKFSEDTSVDPDIRSAAVTIQHRVYEIPFFLSETFPTFPEGTPCVAWKVRAADPAAVFACVERSTAVSALPIVARCFSMCFSALAGLLPADDVSQEVQLGDCISATVAFAVPHTLKRLASNIHPIEGVAGTVERYKGWDVGGTSGAASLVAAVFGTNTNAQPQQTVPTGIAGAAAAVGSASASSAASDYQTVALRQVADAIVALARKLVQSISEEEAGVGIQRLLLYCLFNTIAGVVEGLSRVRKWSDQGRQAALQDVTLLSRQLRVLLPAAPQRLADWLMRYTKALSHSSSNFSAAYAETVEALITSHECHRLFSTRQIMSVFERETMARKREVEAALKQANHVDALPWFLLAATT